MNNVSLAGLIGQSESFNPFSLNQANQQEEKSSDFLALFKSQILADSQQSSSCSQDFCLRETSRSETQNTSNFKPVNAWERPEIKEYRKSDKLDSETDAARVKESETESEAVETERSDESKKSDDKKKADGESRSEAAEIWAMLGEDPKLLEVIENLSPEQKAFLVDALSSMSPEDLNAIAAEPEALISEMINLVKEMPESEETRALLDLLSSDDFSQMLSQLAKTIVANAEDTGEKSAGIDENTNSEELLVEGAAAKKSSQLEQTRVTNEVEPAVASDAKSESESESESEAEKKVVGESDVQESLEKTGTDKNEKEAKASESDEDKSARNKPTAVSEKTSNPEESLRSAFRRENQNTSSEPLPQNLNEMGEVETQAEPAPESTFKFNHQAVADKAIVSDEVARKLVSSLLNTSGESGATGHKKAAFTFNPASISSQNSPHSQNNAGNGFANGFSQDQTYSAQASVKQAPVANNSLFLSQLLEKAEMFKTSDGKKVLSLEMDPKELGKMEMELTSRDGTVTAKISAESELAKARLEELAPQIKEQLNTQGINLTEITVDISSRHPDERNNQNMSGEKNKSNRAGKIGAGSGEEIIRKNILPNLRKVALNIQSVDLTV